MRRCETCTPPHTLEYSPVDCVKHSPADCFGYIETKVSIYIDINFLLQPTIRILI